jgi:hypothetical protein
MPLVERIVIGITESSRVSTDALREYGRALYYRTTANFLCVKPGMSDHRYILDQLFAAEVAMLAVNELGTERERQELDAALRVVRRIRTQREISSEPDDQPRLATVSSGLSA